MTPKSLPKVAGSSRRGRGAKNLRCNLQATNGDGHGQKRNMNKAKPIHLAAWNVRTLADRKDSGRAERRTALITRELGRYDIDIAALSETRFLDKGQLVEEKAGYTIFWSGRTKGRKSGVAFAVKTKLVSQLESLPQGINDRIMTMRLPLNDGKHVTLISIYAPTMTNPEENKELFYQQLDEVIRKVPKQDKMIILGDFNARVGSSSDSWKGIIGKHGIGQENSNGKLLLTLCSQHKLIITNTLFQLKNHHKTTWMHPRSKHWHQIDHIICRQSDAQDFRITKAMRGAECSTDHALLRSKVNILVKKKRRPQGKKPPKKLNVKKTESPEIVAQLQEKLATGLKNLEFRQGDTENNWAELKKKISEAALETLGTLKRHNQDWFDDSNEEIETLLKEKYEAHRIWLTDKTCSTKQNRFKQARAKLQKSLREMKDSWWRKKSEEIQRYADTKNAKKFYSSIKKVYGPTQSGNAPIRNLEGDLLTDKEAIDKRFSEHFEQLLNRPSSIDPNAINDIPQRKINEQLGVLPTEEEVIEAIDELQSDKAAGPDGIPPEVFKVGGPALVKRLTEFLCHCWHDGEIPQDLKDARIVHLYKGKGDKSSCDNYRGISLLAIAGKILAKITLNRLSKHLLDEIVPESQCGFRKNRGTVDMIFASRQVQEKCREQNKDLYILFVDLTKAFDTVSRPGLWNILPRLGIPPKMVKIIQSFHDGMKARLVNGDESNEFPVTNGVKQGCVLAPTLFSFIFSMMLLSAFKETDPGVEITYRTDGGIFKTQRLRSIRKISKALVRALLYADDCAIVAHSEADLQYMADALSAATKRFGLTISIKKTEVLYQPAPGSVGKQPEIKIDDQILKTVDAFAYLGSTLTSNNSLDKEISNRIAKASAAFGRLRKRVWDDRGLRAETKCAVYRAVVLSALLYGCEAWTPYRRHIKQMEKFHQRCLRGILNIRWFHRVSNAQVLQQSNLGSIEATLSLCQLRWAGHLVRMEDSRLPKQLFYGELSRDSTGKGNRGTGRPKLRYKDSLKANLKRCHIDTVTWEKQAADRSKWRTTINTKVTETEEAREMAKEEKRATAKSRIPAAPSDTSLTCTVCGRVCASRIGLHSHSRRCIPLPDTASPAPLSSYTCPYCREMFSARPSLYTHLRTHHQHRVDWSGGGSDHSRGCSPPPDAASVAPLSSYTCPHCRETFSARHSLYTHLRTHHQHRVDWSGGGGS